MNPAEDKHVTELLPDFVLDILAEEEILQVCEHLQTCPSCRDELAHMQRVADELPLALVQATPRAEVKQKLMLSVGAQRLKAIPAAQATTFLQRLGRSLSKYLPAIGIALIVLLVVGNLLLWQQLNNALQVTNTPLRVVTLSNTQYSPEAVGTLVVSPNGQSFTLVVDRLTSLEPGKQYQVWLIKGTDHISAAVFSVDPTGHAILQIQAPAPLKQYDAIGISVEPAGGSSAPTGSPVLHAYLTK